MPDLRFFLFYCYFTWASTRRRRARLRISAIKVSITCVFYLLDYPAAVQLLLSTASPVTYTMDETTTSKSYAQAIQSETATNITMELNNSKLVQLGTEQGRPPDDERNLTEGRKSPWLHNNGNFNSDVAILKSDLILPKPLVKVVDNYLWLELDDYTPVELGWGYCLLGFFVGKFPGRNEVLKLTKRWTRAT